MLKRFLPPALVLTFVAAGCLVAPAMAAAEPTIQTSTSVNCGGSVLRFPDKEIQCTVRVRGLGAGATTPTGTVKLAAEGGQIPFSCTLLPFVGPESVCTTKYTTRVAGQQTISASYVGSQTHLPSSGKTTVAVSDTVTVMNCEPESTIDIGESTVCKAEVRNMGAASDSVSGTVSFTSSTEGLDRTSCTLGEDNACSVKFTPKKSGNQKITAAYEGDATHPKSQAEVVIAVRGATKATVDCGTVVRVVGVENEFSCLVRVQNSERGLGPATGFVTLESDGVFLGECKLLQLPLELGAAGQCEHIALLEGGLRTIAVAYPGDELHQPSSGSTTVPVAATTTSLTCDRESLAVGEAVTCTAEVKNTGVPADSLGGFLSFESENEGRFEPGRCTIEEGSDCTVGCNVEETNVCTVKYFPEVGADHRIIARYSGDNAHPGSLAEVPLTVRGTTVKLTCTPQSNEVNGIASCLARVVNKGLGSKTLSGTVRFTSSNDGSFSSGVCTLTPFLNDGGFCSTTYTLGGPGAHFIHAVYSGDGTHPRAIDGSAEVNAPSPSPSREPTTTRFSCERSPMVGETARCAVQVRRTSTSQGPAPTGRISLDSPQAPTGQFTPCELKPVDSAESTCTSVYIPVINGSQLLFATFRGDEIHAPSQTSRRLAYPTTAKVDCGDSAVVGEPIACTATVQVHDEEPHPTEGAPTPPTGVVRFSSPTEKGAFSPASCNLKTAGPEASTCTVSFTPQAPGNHSISVSYGPEPNHDSSFGGTSLVARSD